MARPTKQGLEYFALDVNMSDEVEIIEAEHGLNGFAILIKLFQRIYLEGYYYDWNEREQILFSNRVGVDRKLLTSIVNDCVRWDIFNNDLYNKYNILTSKRIQEHYFTATYKRVDVEADRNYLMIDVSERKNIKYIRVTDDGNKTTTSKTDDNKGSTIDVTDEESTQSKVKEKRVDKTKTEDSKKDMYGIFFEEVWQLYPNKKGKGTISETKKKEIYHIGEEFKRCISRYDKYVKDERKKGFKDLKYQNGSTFFNSGYIDYLDENVEEKEVKKRPPLKMVYRDTI